MWGNLSWISSAIQMCENVGTNGVYNILKSLFLAYILVSFKNDLFQLISSTFVSPGQPLIVDLGVNDFWTVCHTEALCRS